MKISIEKGDDKCGSEHGPCVNSLTKAVEHCGQTYKSQ